MPLVTDYWISTKDTTELAYWIRFHLVPLGVLHEYKHCPLITYCAVSDLIEARWPNDDEWLEFLDVRSSKNSYQSISPVISSAKNSLVSTSFYRALRIDRLGSCCKLVEKWFPANTCNFWKQLMTIYHSRLADEPTGTIVSL